MIIACITNGQVNLNFKIQHQYNKCDTVRCNYSSNDGNVIECV